MRAIFHFYFLSFCYFCSCRVYWSTINHFTNCSKIFLMKRTWHTVSSYSLILIIESILWDRFFTLSLIKSYFCLLSGLHWSRKWHMLLSSCCLPACVALCRSLHLRPAEGGAVSWKTLCVWQPCVFSLLCSSPGHQGDTLTLDSLIHSDEMLTISAERNSSGTSWVFSDPKLHFSSDKLQF